MDDGRPIAYSVLEHGVPVRCADGHQIGKVEHIVAAPESDIFHGIVLRVSGGSRFVAAEHVTAIHEHAVDLALDQNGIAELPEPQGGAFSFSVDHTLHGGTWGGMIDRMRLHRGWKKGE